MNHVCPCAAHTWPVFTQRACQGNSSLFLPSLFPTDYSLNCSIRWIIFVLQFVLGLLGIELNFFSGPWFMFVLEAVLLHRDVSVPGKQLRAFLLLTSLHQWEGWGCTRNGKGSQPGQLTPAQEHSIPNRVLSSKTGGEVGGWSLLWDRLGIGQLRVSKCFHLQLLSFLSYGVARSGMPLVGSIPKRELVLYTLALFSCSLCCSPSSCTAVAVNGCFSCSLEKVSAIVWNI